ncbi:hypothetical protein ACMYSQ_001134 [Aspergillus niger]
MSDIESSRRFSTGNKQARSRSGLVPFDQWEYEHNNPESRIRSAYSPQSSSRERRGEISGDTASGSSYSDPGDEALTQTGMVRQTLGFPTLVGLELEARFGFPLETMVRAQICVAVA